MKPTDLCHRIEERAAELAAASASPEQPGPLDADLGALLDHARACGACGGALAYHRGLAKLLQDSLEGVPDVVVPVPTLPRAPVRLLPRWRSAAAAAAILVGAVALGQWAVPKGERLAGEPGVPVRVLVVEAHASAPAVPDQELMALTAGWEAVASLRPVLAQ